MTAQVTWFYLHFTINQEIDHSLRQRLCYLENIEQEINQDLTAM